jgi:membrane glycosyltransferase
MDHEEAVIEFFRSMAGDMRFLEALNQKGRKENGEKNMSQVIDYYLEKGKEEGKEQQKKDNAVSLATNGVDLQVISNSLHVSVEQIKQWVQEAKAA